MQISKLRVIRAPKLNYVLVAHFVVPKLMKLRTGARHRSYATDIYT